MAGFCARLCYVPFTGSWGGQLALESQQESQVIVLTCPDGSQIKGLPGFAVSHPQHVIRVLLLTATSFTCSPTRTLPCTPEPLFPQSQCVQSASSMGLG